MPDYMQLLRDNIADFERLNGRLPNAVVLSGTARVGFAHLGEYGPEVEEILGLKILPLPDYKHKTPDGVAVARVEW